jgi:hypothetical protein
LSFWATAKNLSKKSEESPFPLMPGVGFLDPAVLAERLRDNGGALRFRFPVVADHGARR